MTISIRSNVDKIHRDRLDNPHEVTLDQVLGEDPPPYYLTTEFISESTGEADAGKPVILDETGKLDSSLFAVEYAEKLAEDFTCNVGSVVGDIVIADPAIDLKVLSLSSNIYQNIAFGVIVEKYTDTSCKVLISGKITTSETLSPGKPVFISPTGVFTTTPPTSGHRQILGIAIASSIVYLSPSPEKVVLP